MGIERARVVEVHSAASRSGHVGSGYLVSDRLVLTAGAVAGPGMTTDVRRAGTGPWVPASAVWVAAEADAAVLELDEPSNLSGPPAALRWGRVAGPGTVAVMAIGFPSANGRPEWVRDPVQFMGTLSTVEPEAMAVTPSGGRGLSGADGMSGAALFAGADLVGVLLVEADPATRLHAVPVARLADDPSFVELVGTEQGLALTPVRAQPVGFAILQAP
jgi:hypothetical protein